MIAFRPIFESLGDRERTDRFSFDEEIIFGEKRYQKFTTGMATWQLEEAGNSYVFHVSSIVRIDGNWKKIDNNRLSYLSQKDIERYEKHRKISDVCL